MNAEAELAANNELIEDTSPINSVLEKNSSTMPPSPHPFRDFFTNVKNPNNPTNAIAVCNWCIRKYGELEMAQLMPKCCTVNRALLCHNHLSEYEAFREANTEEEVQKILNLPQNKVLAMSQIRSDILWSRKIKSAREYDNQAQQLHIAAPILSDKEADEQELAIMDLDYRVSDNDSNEKETTTRSYNQINQNFRENKDLVMKEEQM
ncbi:17285_t:CDS:2 [Cetraspora pellucida]|uniref:17285_t:CDS:1 n=1 Tax=Cetraspora pellucida TaxID=1433469 RepID=A0ACA9KSN8_9GLOM|nr:17285_t:CDS:2 [Cetraspora pellucida]